MSFLDKIKNLEQYPILLFLIKWMVIVLFVGFFAGSASALLLISLDWVTNYREQHLWIIALLPLGGFVIGLMYYYWGNSVTKGNNLLLEEVHTPRNIIPFKMAPLIFVGTVLTHLFGGSAGREGTAVQMGGAIADQFSKVFKLKDTDRKIIIITGISAGFASVFGTPLAGAIFALEVLIVGRIRYEAIFPSFFVAVIAHYTCHSIWHVSHTHYSIPFVPEMTPMFLLYTVLVGIIFGLVALMFSKFVHLWTNLGKKLIKYLPLRTFSGGIVIALAVYLMGTTKYIGLGVPTIVDSFTVQQQWYDFLLKLLFTTFTLGVGFKGGEVTPLFFIGATLGSALFLIIPLPMALLAGMGFVAVFAGATNTPIACTVMGIELFGAETGVFIAIACVCSYLFSGHTGIYTSQIIGSPKHKLYVHLKGLSIASLDKKEKS